MNIMTEKYLALPPLARVDKSDCLEHLIDIVCIILSGWKELFFPFGAKKVLPKAAIQAIPVYAMSVFKLFRQIIKG